MVERVEVIHLQSASYVYPVKQLSIRTTQLEKCVGIREKGGLSQAE